MALDATNSDKVSLDDLKKGQQISFEGAPFTVKWINHQNVILENTDTRAAVTLVQGQIYESIRVLTQLPSKISDEEMRFITAIREKPNELSLRLIYADWLEERGDPKGEFIRIQCALSELPEKDPGVEELKACENELLLSYREAWMYPIRRAYQGFIYTFEYTNGLLGVIGVSAHEFVKHGDSLVQLASLKHIRFFGTHCGEIVANCPFVLGIPHISMTNLALEDRDIIALARSLYLNGLQSLDLRGNPHITNTGFDALRLGLPNLKLIT